MNCLLKLKQKSVSTSNVLKSKPLTALALLIAGSYPNLPGNRQCNQTETKSPTSLKQNHPIDGSPKELDYHCGASLVQAVMNRVKRYIG
jgi:hypothetical protein